MNAVRREDARHVRYGRPVSVVLLELTREATGLALDAIASDVADVICGEARSTDRAVRLTAGSFRILMPETAEHAARAAAGRLERTYEATPSGDSGERLRIAVATCSGSQVAHRGSRGRRGAARHRGPAPDVLFRLGRGAAVSLGDAGGLANERRDEVIELGGRVIAQTGMDLARLDHRARRGDEPVEPLGLTESGDRPCRLGRRRRSAGWRRGAAGSSPDRAPAPRRRGGARRARSGQRGSDAAGRAGRSRR